jgi:hypothetical protein
MSATEMGWLYGQVSPVVAALLACLCATTPTQVHGFPLDHAGGTGVHVQTMMIENVEASAETLMGYFYSGVHISDMVTPEFGWNSIPLYPQAAAAVESCLTQNYIDMGIWGSILNGLGEAYGYTGPPDLIAYLRVGCDSLVYDARTSLSGGVWRYMLDDYGKTYGSLLYGTLSQYGARHGWSRFDVSGIPDSATVTDVDFVLYQYSPAAITEPVGTLLDVPQFALEPSVARSSGIQLRYALGKVKQLNVAVFDGTGRRRLASPVCPTTTQGLAPLNVAGLPPGAYVVCVTCGDFVRTLKLVLER